MPNTLATAVWPTAAAQMVARNRPIEVAVRTIGIAAPSAVNGTTPTNARPSATEPAMKQEVPAPRGYRASRRPRAPLRQAPARRSAPVQGPGPEQNLRRMHQRSSVTPLRRTIERPPLGG